MMSEHNETSGTWYEIAPGSVSAHATRMGGVTLLTLVASQALSLSTASAQSCGGDLVAHAKSLIVAESSRVRDNCNDTPRTTNIRYRECRVSSNCNLVCSGTISLSNCREGSTRYNFTCTKSGNGANCTVNDAGD